MIVGIGIIVGSWVSLSIVGKWAMGEDGVMNYPKLFSAPMWAALICLGLLLAFYPSHSPRRGDVPEVS